MVGGRAGSGQPLGPYSGEELPQPGTRHLHPHIQTTPPHTPPALSPPLGCLPQQQGFPAMAGSHPGRFRERAHRGPLETVGAWPGSPPGSRVWELGEDTRAASAPGSCSPCGAGAAGPAHTANSGGPGGPVASEPSTGFRGPPWDTHDPPQRLPLHTAPARLRRAQAHSGPILPDFHLSPRLSRRALASTLVTGLCSTGRFSYLTMSKFGVEVFVPDGVSPVCIYFLQPRS